MIVLGMAGAAGAGKDSVADHLVRAYGFVKFSFSDALYREVAAAYGLESTDMLYDRSIKEVRSPRFALRCCADVEFNDVAIKKMDDDHKTRGIGFFHYPDDIPLSPRWVLQTWGTEFRRAQDPDYLVKKADEWIYDLWTTYQYGELRPQLFVNTSVRFPNEREWIHKFTNGNVWHVHRDSLDPVHAHCSETPLLVQVGEREIFNNDSLERLYAGVDLLLQTNARFVKIEPMLPDQEPI